MQHRPEQSASDAGALSARKKLGQWPALVLGWIFLKIGATAFGGIGAVLALIERELVTRRSMLTEADITEALTYTKLLPGSTVVQVMAYLGYKLAVGLARRWPPVPSSFPLR